MFVQIKINSSVGGGAISITLVAKFGITILDYTGLLSFRTIPLTFNRVSGPQGVEIGGS